MATLPPNILDISADLLPAEMFLYPVCTTREGFAAMLEAMDNYYKSQHERVELIKDFLNAQEFVGNPLEQPCIKELVDELLANQQPQIKYVELPVDECESECDDMACSSCKNAVRFCNGRLEYTDENGVTQAVPGTAIPSEENEGLPAGTQPDADCWKANGLWDAFAAFANGVLDVVTDDTLTRTGAVWSAAFTERYPSLKFIQSALAAVFFNSALELDTLGEAQALKTAWQAAIEDYKLEFICATLGYMTKDALLSIPEVTQYRTFPIDGFSAALTALLEDLRAVPTSGALQTFVNNRVLAKSGDCPCSGGAPIPEIPPGASLVKSSIVDMHTHLTGSPPTLAAVLDDTGDGIKTGSKWTGERYYDGSNTLYKIGVLLEMSPAAFQINGCSFKVETQSGGGYVAATLYQWNGDDPSDAFAEQGRTPDDESTSPVPSGFVNYSSGAMGGTFKYLLIGVGVAYDGNVTKIARLSDILLNVTIGGEVFNWVLPDVPIYPS